MGDVAKLLAYICKTPGPGTYNLTYYCELWAHEVLRVFGDRVRDSNLKEALIK